MLMRLKDKKTILAELGKFFLDVAKLIFGGVILVGIMDMDINKVMLFVVGFCVMLLMLILGVMLMVLSDYNT